MSTLSDAINTGLVDFGLLHEIINGDASTSVTTEGGPVPSLSKIIATIYNTVLASITTSSQTNQAITVGTLTFTVDANKSFSTGQPIVIANQNGYMYGNVVSYSGTTLVVQVTQIQGQGTYNSWAISFSGPAGPQGPGATSQADPAETLITKMPWE